MKLYNYETRWEKLRKIWSPRVANYLLAAVKILNGAKTKLINAPTKWSGVKAYIP